MKVLSTIYGVVGAGGWYLGDKVESFCSSVVKAWWKLGPGEGLVDSLFRQNIRFLLGKGDKTFFWKDLWLGERPLKHCFSIFFRISRNANALVQDFVNWDNGAISWHLDFCRGLRSFEEDSRSGLLTLLEKFPFLPLDEDEMIWSGDSSGIFSVKALVHLAQSQLSNDEKVSKSIWESAIPPRVQIFLWCVLKEKILKRVELNRRGLLRGDVDLNCILCDSSLKDINHLFVNCDVAKGLWTNSLTSWGFLGSLQTLSLNH